MGIKIDITPTVNTDGFITVKVEPEVSTIFEFIGPDNNIPRVKSRKSSTTIRVKDGEKSVNIKFWPILNEYLTVKNNIISELNGVMEKIVVWKTWPLNQNLGLAVGNVGSGVSKTFKMEDIMPLIDYGHQDFGENKVQEAFGKWKEVKANKNHVKLHMIGKLQTNKVKQAVSIFDYIHSVDSIKLAKKISEEQIKQNKNLKLF